MFSLQDSPQSLCVRELWMPKATFWSQQVQWVQTRHHDALMQHQMIRTPHHLLLSLTVHPLAHRWCLQRRQTDQPEAHLGRSAGEVQGKVGPAPSSQQPAVFT